MDPDDSVRDQVEDVEHVDGVDVVDGDNDEVESMIDGELEQEEFPDEEVHEDDPEEMV